MLRAAVRVAIPLCLALATGAAGCEGCSKPEVAAPDASAAQAAMADAGPVNVTVVPTAEVERLVNPDKLPAYTGPTGSVEGTIYVVGDRAPETPDDFHKCPDAARTFGHAFREGEPATPSGPRWLADAVVAVTGYSDAFVPERTEAEELTIEGCAFARRTVTMTFGQRLEVKNLAKEYWTPKLEPSTGIVNMAIPGGDPVKIYPKKPGRYHLVDLDRRYASADVFTFLHPLHTSSGALGAYRIDGVPVGKVTVNTSHPRIPGADASQEIEVKAGVVHRVDLTIEHKRVEAPASTGGASGVRLR